MLSLDALGGPDDQDVRSIDEQAGFYNPGNVVQRDFQLPRLVDSVNMDIHNHIAGLGFEWGAVLLTEYHAAFGQCFDLARRTSPAERDHLNGERE
jgi:hypothetical protein